MDSNSVIDPSQKLPEWVNYFDKRFLSKLDLTQSGNQYFSDSYNRCFILRNDFQNIFLPKLESDLGFPSLPSNYKYENFFKSQYFPDFELSKNYFYDDNINLLKKNYSTANIRNNEMKNKNSTNKNGNNLGKKDNLNNNSYHNNNKYNTGSDKINNIYNRNNKEEEKVNFINNKFDKSKEYKKENTNIKNYLKNQKDTNVESNINSIKYKNQYNKINEKDNKKDNSILKKNDIKENNYLIKTNTFKKTENIPSSKQAKDNNKNINQNNINRINQIYNKNIIPIKEESYDLESNEKEDDKKKSYIKNYQKNTKAQSIINNKPIDNLSNTKISKNQAIKATNNSNIKIIQTSKEQKEIKQKINNDIKQTNKSENLGSSSKSNSIKNYLIAKKPNYPEENKTANEDIPKLKGVENKNHSNIKNYLKNNNK